MWRPLAGNPKREIKNVGPFCLYVDEKEVKSPDATVWSAYVRVYHFTLHERPPVVTECPGGDWPTKEAAQKSAEESALPAIRARLKAFSESLNSPEPVSV